MERRVKGWPTHWKVGPVGGARAPAGGGGASIFPCQGKKKRERGKMWMMHLHLQVQNYVKLNARLQLDAVGDELWQWTLL